MLTIEKIKLHNFKRFRDLTINVNPDINIFVGDNESGKSTILQAIDLVARGSVPRVENIGLDRLFNIETINEYMKSNRDQNKLPEMYIEIYLDNQTDVLLEGQCNSAKQTYSGIRLRCFPNDNLSQQIACVLKNQDAAFPFEFYKIEFDTFAGEPFNAYTKKLKSLFIDNSIVGGSRAMREYVNDIYNSQLTDVQRINARHAYTESKIQFQRDVLAQYNELISPYSFAIRESADDNIEADITLMENGIPLENKGMGIQCFIKTRLAMNRTVNNVDVVLMEEPENHLSHTKMLELINLIRRTQNRQLFISTHCDLIATRLNLKKCLLLNSSSTSVVSLFGLSDETAKFFIKAPNNNMLQFVLSKKSILVEGDAEFILMEALYRRTTGKELFDSGIGVIAVGGKCFKRYMEIATLLSKKVVVITDNDHDYVANITSNYSDYTKNQFDNIRVWSDKDNNRYTFEVCLYQYNQEICDKEFCTSGRTLTVMDYMLKNKSDAAYRLLLNRADTLVVPLYIQEAIRWIDA